MTQWLNDLITV